MRLSASSIAVSSWTSGSSCVAESPEFAKFAESADVGDSKYPVAELTESELARIASTSRVAELAEPSELAESSDVGDSKYPVAELTESELAGIASFAEFAVIAQSAQLAWAPWVSFGLGGWL